MEEKKNRLKHRTNNFFNLNFFCPFILISDERYHYWCISAVDDEEGHTHLFVARWPSDVNFDVGWRTVSEIAHFVGESPEGPFEEVGTVFSNENLPEGQTAAHNPRITKIDGVYCLLYMVQTSEGHKVCMATSDSPNGPWKLAGEDGIVVAYNGKADNPDLIKVGDKYHLYFKTDVPDAGISFFVAVSDSLTGSYTVKNRVMDNYGSTEDCCVFEWKGKYFMMTYDHSGSMTGGGNAGMLWVSEDGLNFKIADTQIGY